MGLFDAIAKIVGSDNVTNSRADCLAYSRDMSIHEAIPDIIVFAKTSEHVQNILKVANETKTPVTCRGTGSSVTGASLAHNGGIILDFTKMDRITKIDFNDGYAVVEPGVICSNLNRMLAPTHFFPPDPGSALIATLGGMIATNASGVRAAKYGTTRDYIKGLTIVLADGKIIQTGKAVPKQSAGYNLTQLFAGSEGTLGIITEAILKIIPVPEFEVFTKVSFPNVNQAAKAVEQIYQIGIQLSTCEILDEICLKICRDILNIAIADETGCQLFIALDGWKAAVLEHAHKVEKICLDAGGKIIPWSHDPDKKSLVFTERRALVPALSRLKSGHRLIPIMEDIDVPLSRIPATIRAIQQIGEKYGITIATLGHIGDGNLHPTFIADPKCKTDWEKIEMICNELIELTLDNGGSLSAEHGIGMTRSPYIHRQLGSTLDVMQAIKKSLDPHNILNPGKMGFAGSIEHIFDQNAFQQLISATEVDEGSSSSQTDEILSCIQCGYCRAGCPTFEDSSLESLNAKGRITLAFNLLANKIDCSEDIAQRLYQCLQCNNCKSFCPARIEVAEIIALARHSCVEAGYLPEALQKAIESTHMQSIELSKSAVKYQHDLNYGSQPISDVKTEYTAYFGCPNGCGDKTTKDDFLKILRHADTHFAYSEIEFCCGLMAYEAGDLSSFRQIVINNKELLKRIAGKKIISTCSGCLRSFQQLYPKYTDMSQFEFIHSTEFLVSLIDTGKLSFADYLPKVKAAYHDSCSLGRHLGIYDPPRQIINSIPGVTLKEFQKNRSTAKCCGAGGGLDLTDPELARRIGQRRIEQFVELDADVLITTCNTCKNHLIKTKSNDARQAQAFEIKSIEEFVCSRLLNHDRKDS